MMTVRNVSSSSHLREGIKNLMSIASGKDLRAANLGRIRHVDEIQIAIRTYVA